MTNILIDSDKKLHNLLSKIEDCKEIGLDTEFIRESTYRPILALIQISLANGEIYLIDPQKIKDISVFDIDASKLRSLKKKFKSIKIFDSLDKLIKSKLDCIFLVTPPSKHYFLAREKFLK